jgi:hypothetical protein
MSPDGRQRCRRCETACCPACAFSLDGATYCGRCAESILDLGGIALTVSAQGHPVPGSDWASPELLRRPTLGAAAAPWLILVARDQADLFAHLVRVFSRDDKVEVLMDRRRNASRNPPGMEDRLRVHGAAVIRRGAFGR